MSVCPKCNYISEETINFCPLCGAQMVADKMIEEPVLEEAQIIDSNPPQYTYDQTYNPTGYTYEYPPVKPPHLAFKIVGMALSIAGFIFAIIVSLASLAGLADPESALAMPLVFSIFYAPFSIVGLIFSNKCRNAGDTSTFSRLGKIFGIISIIIYGISIFIGFFALVISELTYY